ncbi:MAG TPA: SurA N-terminal domain-containing protein [Xanthobacteraceae bacterium]|jgi:peptidyl-prolyl cis-trans isomerase SurA
MAAIFKLLYPGFLSRGLALGAAALIVTAAIGGAQAQNVVAFVNGEPITALDVDQRSRLIEVSSPTHKPPPRSEVLDELINEKLQIREAKRWGIDPTDDDVNQAFASAAQQMHMNTEQFVQTLTKAGVTPMTFRARLRAQLVWAPLVRGRYQSSLEIFDKDILQEMINKKTDADEAASFDYTLRPILFVVPPGSPVAAFEDRKREAEGLRNRFRSCDDGLPFARALKDVAVRDQIVRSSADIPAELRKGLDAVPVGQLTTPEVTKLGIEMFAVCAKDAAKSDNAVGKKQARETLFTEKFKQQSNKYLQELRKAALIEPGPAK